MLVVGEVQGAVKDATFGIFTTVDEDCSLADCDPDLEILTAEYSSPTPESDALLNAQTFQAESELTPATDCGYFPQFHLHSLLHSPHFFSPPFSSPPISNLAARQ